MAPGLSSRRIDAILALGSNMGDKAANISRALSLIEDRGDVRVVARSRDFRSEPWGKTDQDWFVNACAAVMTDLAPHALLDRCQEVEARMGRVRAERWGPRIIDVDILVHRAGEFHDDRLSLPHPRTTERAFVLVPLADIAPDLVIAGKSVSRWLDEIDTGVVQPFEPRNVGPAPGSRKNRGP